MTDKKLHRPVKDDLDEDNPPCGGSGVPEKSALSMLKSLKIACLLMEEGSMCFEDGYVCSDKSGNVFVSGMSIDDAIERVEKQKKIPKCSRCGLKYRRRFEPEVCSHCKIVKEGD